MEAGEREREEGEGVELDLCPFLSSSSPSMEIILPSGYGIQPGVVLYEEVVAGEERELALLEAAAQSAELNTSKR